MAYEIFTRKVVRASTPTITITPYARINFNKAVVKIFEANAIEQILLLWDAEKRRLAVRPINKKDPRAYPISYKAKETGVGISAKTFLDHYGIDNSETRSFPAVWNGEELLLEAELPPEVVKNTKQRVLQLDGDIRHRAS